jgi:hypothetical protein
MVNSLGVINVPQNMISHASMQNSYNQPLILNDSMGTTMHHLLNTSGGDVSMMADKSIMLVN